MKEIKATAPTPQDWIELVRENERLKEELERMIRRVGRLLIKIEELENKTND